MAVAPARLEDSPRFGDGALRMGRVVQRLAEERHIHCAGAYGHVFQVAQAVFQVGDAVLARQLGAELHHFSASCRWRSRAWRAAP